MKRRSAGNDLTIRRHLINNPAPLFNPKTLVIERVTMLGPFKVGVDFDNTIVRYDQIFHRAAVERGLIPDQLAVEKGTVRNYLRDQGREDAWTELQGYVYGCRMAEAQPFPGVKDFFAHCRNRGIDLFIISHKTTTPYRGPEYDLHQAARSWLADQGFLAPQAGGVPPHHVHLEPTKEAKLMRIGTLDVDVFLDDLPEFLLEPDFPSGVKAVLFDPAATHPDASRLARVASWDAFGQFVEREVASRG